MSPVVFLSCLLIIACSNAATTKKQDVTRYSTTKVETRQDVSYCSTMLNNLPSRCNLSKLFGRISNLSVHDVLTDAQLDALNSTYSRICVPECLDPIEKFYRCIIKSNYTYDFRVKLLRKGVCGQESGEYCTVRYNRKYNGNNNDLSQLLIRTCDITDSGISSCNSNTPNDDTCLHYVKTFSKKMGCCAEPYLGPGVRLSSSCSNVSVDEACTGVSSATGLVAPVFLMLFALVGFFFWHNTFSSFWTLLIFAGLVSEHFFWLLKVKHLYAKSWIDSCLTDIFNFVGTQLLLFVPSVLHIWQHWIRSHSILRVKIYGSKKELK